jgi:hypothetical protein
VEGVVGAAMVGVAKVGLVGLVAVVVERVVGSSDRPRSD